MGGKRKKKNPLSYRQRSYRRGIGAAGLLKSRARVRETDLLILAPRLLADEAGELIIQARAGLEAYIEANPAFVASLVPMAADPLAPRMVRDMLSAARAAGVGPMAAVAGAIAETVGRGLMALEGIDEVVVENGGDSFVKRNEEGVAAIFAGQSPLSNRVGIRLRPEQMPLGVCTSSATIGHSLSLGQADAACVVAASAALADACATRVANETGGADDIEKVLDLAAAIPGIIGVVVIVGERIGAWGEIELVRI